MLEVCKNCRYWTRKEYNDKDSTDLYESVWDGKDIAGHKCKVCGFYQACGDDKAMIVHNHCEKEHQDVIDNATEKRFGECRSPKIEIGSPTTEYPYEDDQLLYEDGEQYSVFLSTGQYFGCVHWEKK